LSSERAEGKRADAVNAALGLLPLLLRVSSTFAVGVGARVVESADDSELFLRFFASLSLEVAEQD
jgi:hypothetical protein